MLRDIAAKGMTQNEATYIEKNKQTHTYIFISPFFFFYSCIFKRFRYEHSFVNTEYNVRSL